MVKRFLTSYFGFHKQQRNGLFLLISISFVLLIVRLSYPYFIKPDPIQVYNLPVMERILDSSSQPENTFHKNENVTDHSSQKLFLFDPNKVTQQELTALGFSKKTSAVFMKFRNKGFVFKQKSDLKKVYGLSDDFYVQLEPYIIIENEIKTEKETKLKQENLPAVIVDKQVQQKIELNGADSLQLISIHGIGNTYARRILKYRSLLGGFVSVEQLKEVYGFNEDLYLKVKDHFTVNAANIKKLNLNTDEFKVINKHPYITYEICKSIFDWRRKTSITATNLKDILLDEVLYHKLLPYLIF